jgi:hypothetical protein
MQTNLNQYILVKVTADGNKLPASRTGEVVSAFDQAHWMSYTEATALAASLGMRVGFVITDADPFFCLDVDKCLNPDGQSWSPLATELCQTFHGCYMELSVSGRGLHIWGRYEGLAPAHKAKNTKLGIELYTKLRFICLGQGLQGDPNADMTAQLHAVVDKYFTPDGTEGDPMEWTDAPVPEWQGPTDDQELLTIMMKSRSVAGIFGSRATFQQLWVADADALAKAYPSSSGDTYDRSSADAALAQHLAYFTGKNCERMRGFMKSSSLRRDKWQREDYLANTIMRAAQRQTRVYNKAKSEDGTSARMAGGFVATEDLPKVFEDCTYIVTEHAVLVPGGMVVKSDQFKVIYGGFKFQLDDQKTTRNAWDAFTSCPSWRPPTVDGRCFRPDLPPLKLVEDNGRLLVNTYIPIRVNQAEGDITPFLQLLERTYVDTTDRNMLLAYAAALVQHPGRKFGWAPLLQGPEGNGKTFFTTAIAEAIGSKYCHTANAGEFTKSGSKFNSWIENKLFVAVHDVRIRSDEDMELLKPLLTDEKVEIQGKGRDQYTGDNRANFIFTSNHLDALKLNDGGRRYAPFAAKQEKPEDLIRDGLTPQFYSDLWDWAHGRGQWDGHPRGFSKIAYYLHNYKVPDMLNPATVATRAPRTSSWEKFVNASKSPVEQEVVEAVEQQRPGFAGGWISSLMLDRYLEERRISKNASLAYRAVILKRLGYVPHPALPLGRAHVDVLPDGGRPRLYVKEDHPAAAIETPDLACQKYTQAQTGGAPRAFGVAGRG